MNNSLTSRPTQPSRVRKVRRPCPYFGGGRNWGRRWAALAKPSQVWRLPAQHQPTLGASRFARPSRPVPPLIQIAGVRASRRVPLGLREAMHMKQ